MFSRLLRPLLLTCTALVAAAGPSAADDSMLTNPGGGEPAFAKLLDVTLKALTPETYADTRDMLRRAAGLNPLPQPRPVDMPEIPRLQTTATVEEANLQFALVQLSMLAGTNDQLSLIKAQPDQDAPKALVMRTGELTLEQLGKAVEAAGIEGLSRAPDGKGWILTRPLVVWQDAALRLMPGEELTMSTERGAFLLSFGRLAMKGATLAGDAKVSARAPSFRPFVMVVGQGSLFADGASFAHLGFNSGSSFGGVVVANSGLFKPEFAPVIVNSRFNDIRMLRFERASDLYIAGNSFAGSSLIFKGGTKLTVQRNILTDSKSTAAIVISDQAKDVALLGNMISGASGMGILVDGLSRRVSVDRNIIDSTEGVGLNIRRSACIAVDGNLVTRADSAAMRLSASGWAWVTNNAVLLNRSAGVEIQDQSTGTRLWLTGNRLAANKVGMVGAGLGDILMVWNDLADQLPRQFGGEFSPHLAGYLKAVEGPVKAGGYSIRDIRLVEAAVADESEFPLFLSSPPGWPDICREE